MLPATREHVNVYSYPSWELAANTRQILMLLKEGSARSIADYARAAVLNQPQFVDPIDSERVQLRILNEKFERIYELMTELDRKLMAEPAAEGSGWEQK